MGGKNGASIVPVDTKNEKQDGNDLRRRWRYEWIVVAAAFICSLVVDGVASSYDVYLTYSPPTDGNSTNSTTPTPGKSLDDKIIATLVGSLLYGVYLGISPISCGLAEMVGYRIVIGVGSVIAALGFSCSYFVTSVSKLYLCLTYGLIGGIGFGLIYAPSILCVCMHFEGKSALAVGVTVSGSSVGGMVMPLLVSSLLHNLQEGQSMFVVGAFALLCFVSAIFMRSPNLKSVKKDDYASDKTNPVKRVLSELTDWTVYRIPEFAIFSIASFLGSIAFLVPIFWLIQLGKEKYISDVGDHDSVDRQATFLLTYLSAANMVGRIFWTWLVDYYKLDSLLVHNVCILISGILLMFFPSSSFVGLIALSILYGFFIAPFICLMSTVITSRTEVKRLPSTFGQIQLLGSGASVIGPLIYACIAHTTNEAGQFSDNNAKPFYYGGGNWIITAIVASCIYLLPKKKPVEIDLQETHTGLL